MTTPPHRDDTAPRRRTGWWFLAFTLVCLGGAGSYIVTRSRPAAPASAPQAFDRGQLDDIRRGPHVYFRSARGSEFGTVVVAALDAPDVRRVVTGLACDRLDFGRSGGICLVDNRGRVGAMGLAHVVDRNLEVRHTIGLAGFPIRARLSPDERYAVATVFVTGESYESDFTTRTVIIDMQTGALLGDLEQYDTQRDGERFSRVDFNFWGVTFRADGRSFYATLGSAGMRYLVAGDVPGRRLTIVNQDVECPSLSPDETRLVFKQRTPGSPAWRLHALDLASGQRWPIAETRSIDDQVEWLDADHVLYQVLETRGLPEEALHVWKSPVGSEDSTRPAIFIRSASSPAVVF